LLCDSAVPWAYFLGILLPNFAISVFTSASPSSQISSWTGLHFCVSEVIPRLKEVRERGDKELKRPKTGHCDKKGREFLKERCNQECQIGQGKEWQR
jgi:hypothetical protein